MDVFFDFATTILLHECFIKQACKPHFEIDIRKQNTLLMITSEGCSQWVKTNAKALRPWMHNRYYIQCHLPFDNTHNAITICY